MKLIARLALAVSMSAVPTVAIVAPSLACGNSFRYELDPKTNMLVRAEESLHEGDFKKAYKLAVDASGAVGKTVEGKGAPAKLEATRARALRVAAVAAIKTQGKVAGDKQAQATTSWAIDQLRVLAERENKNPYLMARLAEGLAQQPQGEAGAAEALQILAKLADDDMMPDAAAWLLYGQLSTDDKVKTRALAQCKLRANDPAVCKLKGPGES